MRQLLDRINHLSKRDKKNLSQKGAKVAEELGELFKAILPMENAHGTNHRVPSSDKIIEECADIMLAAYSIVASMDVPIEQFSNVLSRKSDYWEFLMDNEDNIDVENLDFEIHITVKDISSLQTFSDDCRTLDIKPIVLDLYTEGATIKDVMTSSRFKGSTKDAVNYTKQLGRKLRSMGYNVVREKIETVPWHPVAQHNPIKNSAYFEAHIAFTDNTDVSEFSKQHSIHLSKNMMKKNDKSVIMGTYRVDATLTNKDDFKNQIDYICEQARNKNLEILEKPLIEYSLYDTLEEHDKEWING